ncbi:MAG TPA: FecR domain-containing protein [Chitinophagaceae bacterium]|nr:FecR domain-containing protein [Chitinophagaceae bacterium]
MEERQILGAYHTARLIFKYIQGELSEQEQQELDAWVEQSDANRALFSEMTNPVRLNTALDEFRKTDKRAGWERLQQRLFVAEPKRVIFSGAFFRIAATVILVLLVGGGAWFMTTNNKKGMDEGQALIAKPTDKKPGEKKAQLVMDGRTIDLEKVFDSTFTEQDGVSIVNGKGVLSYNSTSAARGTARHTIVIPRGGEYQVVLEDGTRIWMNSASSLSYPAHFDGKDRRVELTGEAYFEVAPNKQKPFIVQSSDLQIEALGTSFNVMSYAEEPSTRTTLVEGKVRVRLGGEAKMLEPGKTAETVNGSIKIRPANIAQETGWRDGLFSFHNTGIREVMNQLSRWYDVDVRYEEGVLSNHITGDIPRSDSLKTALKKLALTGSAKFAIENNSVIVLKSN